MAISNVIEQQMQRKSVRHFLDRPVDRELLLCLLEAAQHSPTTEFIQAYSVIQITDPTLRQRIYQEAAQQEQVLKAPVFLVFCADMSRLLRSAAACGTAVPPEFLKHTEDFLISSVDAAILAESFVICAESVGLGTCYVGGIRNNLESVCQLLKLPAGVYPLVGMTVGYPDPDQVGSPKPRLPLETVLMVNTYSVDSDTKRMADYDEMIRHYYLKRTNGERNETWQEQMTDFVLENHRPKLKDTLQKQGFMLE